MKIKNINKILLDTPVPVYDLEVEKYHNFAVGKEMNIVHNCEYLHGNLDGVIIGLAQNFSGTNNIPLITREGNFGTRFSQEASASRYIYTFGSKELFSLFNKDDNNILINQTFEGSKIEPRFYVPNLPILLINGSEGISSGFAQKILPRNPECIKQYIKEYLKDPIGNIRPNKGNSLVPFYKGFKGTIESGENDKQWIIKGLIKRISSIKIEILEVPIGYDLQGYLNVLDDLEDRKIINSFKDKSENDNFHFEVSMNSKVLSELTDDQLLEKLKLSKKVTENYTCMDENNKIIVFNSVRDIIKSYIDIKLKFLEKRKQFKLDEMYKELQLQIGKTLFIMNVIKGEIQVNNKAKIDIISQIEKFPKIPKSDESYEYLLKMPIYSLTKEKVQELKEIIIKLKENLNTLISTDIKDIWIGEI